MCTYELRHNLLDDLLDIPLVYSQQQQRSAAVINDLDTTMNAKADQAQCRSYTRTAHHDMTRIQVYLCHRLVVAIGQLHQGATCAVLGLFRPRFVDEHIQYVDDGRVCREGCASRWEQRDLLHALSKVALHRCLDRLICVFARVCSGSSNRPSIKRGMNPELLLKSICLAVSLMQRDSKPRQRLVASASIEPQASHRMSSVSSAMI